MLKKILPFLFVFLLPISALASPVSWDGNVGTGILQPLQAFWNAEVRGAFFHATSTTASSTLQNTEVNQLKIGSLTGLLKGVSGFITTAVANTDYQSPISLTTTGTSGVSTFNGTTLNIPNYTSSGGSSFPFTPTSYGVSTTTTIGFLNGFLSTASSTINSNFFLSNLAQGLLYTGTSGLVQTRATTTATCAGGTSCSSFVVLGSSPITITGTSGTVTSVGLSSLNSTLTIGSTPVTSSGTITGDLNLAHSNNWSVLQSFTNASTSLSSHTSTAYFGATATSTINADGKGSIVIPSTGDITETGRGVAAGSFVAYDANGKLIATTTPSGTSGNVQTFTSNGTWTKPGSGTSVTVCLIGGGGGGGSGGSGAAGSGGAGGSDGALICSTFPISALGSTVSVTVGATAAGGTTVTAGAGHAGTTGNNTSFGTTLVAKGGTAGNGGAITGNALGATGVSIPGMITTTGGGGGGGFAANTTGGNGTDSVMNAPNITGGAGASPSNTGGTGTSATANTFVMGGAGGGGGGAFSGGGGTFGVGGPGGLYGGGGGGGAGCAAVDPSGAGSTGAAGIAVVVTNP